MKICTVCFNIYLVSRWWNFFWHLCVAVAGPSHTAQIQCKAVLQMGEIPTRLASKSSNVHSTKAFLIPLPVSYSSSLTVSQVMQVVGLLFCILQLPPPEGHLYLENLPAPLLLLWRLLQDYFTVKLTPRTWEKHELQS